MTHWSTKYLGRAWEPPAFDCWRLVVQVYAERGISVRGFGVDANDVWAVRREFQGTTEYENWVPVGISGAAEYDVVLMSMGRVPTHVGVCVGGPRFQVLHCIPMGGTGIDDEIRLRSMSYRVVECYRRRDGV